MEGSCKDFKATSTARLKGQLNGGAVNTGGQRRISAALLRERKKVVE